MAQRVIVLGTKGYSSWYIEFLESIVFIGVSANLRTPYTDTYTIYYIRI